MQRLCCSARNGEFPSEPPVQSKSPQPRFDWAAGTVLPAGQRCFCLGTRNPAARFGTLLQLNKSAGGTFPTEFLLGELRDYEICFAQDLKMMGGN